jgi:hypothetical protein
MSTAICPLCPLTQIYVDQRLEFPIDPRHKTRHVKALLQLSRASGLCPECLVLKGIKMEAHPVDRGGYGDVYKGVLHDQEIAVKALRIYQTSDLFRLLKVALRFRSFTDLH